MGTGRLGSVTVGLGELISCLQAFRLLLHTKGPGPDDFGGPFQDPLTEDLRLDSGS